MDWTDKDKIQTAVQDSLTKTETLKRLGLGPWSGNFRTLQKYAVKYGIDLSHLLNPPPRIAYKILSHPKYGLDEILIVDSPYTNTSQLKKRLICEELLEEKCSICGCNPEWNNKRLVLILDHINGISNDHRLQNLRLVCPNCNSQLPTHCGKNKGRRRRAGRTGL